MHAKSSDLTFSARQPADQIYVQNGMTIPQADTDAALMAPAGLSGELTEQLRLILEPTKATRLAGEYRSGKRLAMRKVIAYIASHFRKDKIWLRRTRPNQRTYQVSHAVIIHCIGTSAHGSPHARAWSVSVKQPPSKCGTLIACRYCHHEQDPGRYWGSIASGLAAEC